MHLLKIKITRNNTFITLQKDYFHAITLFTTSLGTTQYKNTQKTSEIAHTKLIANLQSILRHHKVRELYLLFTGKKRFRYLIANSLKTKTINVRNVMDLTTMYHNGCRVSKKRRL